MSTKRLLWLISSHMKKISASINYRIFCSNELTIITITEALGEKKKTKPNIAKFMMFLYLCFLYTLTKEKTDEGIFWHGVVSSGLSNSSSSVGIILLRLFLADWWPGTMTWFQEQGGNPENRFMKRIKTHFCGITNSIL